MAIDVEPLFEWSEIDAPSDARRAVGFGADDTVLIVSEAEEVLSRLPRPDKRGHQLVRQRRYRTHGWRDGSAWTSEATEPVHDVGFVQPWGDALLLVGSRCELRRSGPERNATVVTWDGATRDQWTLGDGIADVRTHRDRVWCSYFDEGVFGNRGWSLSTPLLGVAGVRTFDARGCPSPIDARLSERQVVDVYALNVCGDDELWMYAYPDFELIRLNRDTLTRRAAGVRGATAFAIDRGRALLFGSYEHREQLVALSLHDGRATQHELRMPWDSPHESRIFASGHRDRLFVWDAVGVGVVRDW